MQFSWLVLRQFTVDLTFYSTKIIQEKDQNRTIIEFITFLAHPIKDFICSTWLEKVCEITSFSIRLESFWDGKAWPSSTRNVSSLELLAV